MNINPEIGYTEVIAMWKSGDHRRFVEILENDHPGLTALVIVQGCQDGNLTRNDANRIANLLIDSRQEMFKRGEAVNNENL